MQKEYSCQQASKLEKTAKETFAVPPFLMMENAARAMADEITNHYSINDTVLIICGKGNNGGDGYALARLLQDWLKVIVISLEAPAAQEAKEQYEMSRRLGIDFADISQLERICRGLTSQDCIVDCIYGTGFHGQLSSDIKKYIDIMNKCPARKLACDIPSALEFKADTTITMGCQKLPLYSDKAKAVSGKIIVADLGIAREKFEGCGDTDIYLIESDDRHLPLRKNRGFHKGRFGHTAVLCGDKPGAAILAASSAMAFGSGLTSLITNQDASPDSTPLSQFKISPALMISDSIPKKTSCILMGSGFSEFSKKSSDLLLNWFKEADSPAAVLDAGALTSPESPVFLKALNDFENARIVLTPHLYELSRLLEACKESSLAQGDFSEDFSVNELAENPEARIAAGKYLNSLFPKTTVIMKSANTFIASEGQIFVITDGGQSLAKGGSGDILAGLAASLLAQGYTARDAAITAAEHHAVISKELGREAYNLTPEKLIDAL